MICKYVCLSLLRVITNVNILQNMSIPFLPEGNAKFFQNENNEALDHA